MLSTLRNAWNLPDVRKKILNTLLLIVIFRLGFAIPVPFMDRQVAAQIATGGSQLLSYMDMMTGGAFSKFNIFGLSMGGEAQQPRGVPLLEDPHDHPQGGDVMLLISYI